MEPPIHAAHPPRQSRDMSNKLADDLQMRVRETFAASCDLPFPLHSPLPPDAPDADEQAGIGGVPASRRADLALRALAAMARKVADGRTGTKTVGLPTSDLVHSAEEWWARHPGWTAQSPSVQLRCTLEAMQALCSSHTAGLFIDEAPDFLNTAERCLQRDVKAPDKIDKQAQNAYELRLVDPQEAARLQIPLQKMTLKVLAAGIFGTPELDALQPAAHDPPVALPSQREIQASRQRLQKPGGRRALLSRLFLKLLRAHLALPAPDAGKTHLLETTAISLLPAIVAHGAEPLRPVAALLMLGLARQAPALDDTGLPRCFGRETLQKPGELAAQARLVLLGIARPPADRALAEVLQTVQTLARTLARVVTDPLCADALGFDSECFRNWVQQLENAQKPGRLPARLQRASDDNAGAYLALDFLPRMKRWKDQHSALGGQAGNGAQAELDDDKPTLGMAEALQQVLRAGTDAERASVQLPVVQARPGWLQYPPPAH